MQEVEVWMFYFEKQKNNHVRVLGRVRVGRKMKKGQMLMGKRDRKWF